MTSTIRTRETARRAPMARLLVGVIRFYRMGISPLRPASCRYTPTCSAYAVEAIELHGSRRGAGLALRRLLRCHPWHRGGHDPVPPPVERAAASLERPTSPSPLTTTSPAA